MPARRGRAPARLPLAERYVMALTTADARVDVATPEDEEEAAALAAELGAWRDGAVIPAGPVRTCFRLAEPATPEADPWRVEFALQSADDPSLMVSAADVWAGRGGAGIAAGGDPVEELLAGLGAAARLFGELDDALREAAPALVEMDTPGAFRFLKETGPLLAGAGFGVLLPDWVRKARLGLKLTTRSRTASGPAAAGAAVARFGLGDLVDFRYDVAVGDQALDPDELAELARLKVPLVRLRGQWVELDDAHLKAALKFLERNQAGTMTAADALTAGMGLGPGGPTGWTRRSRWSGWTPTAGWATCCPARPTTGCGRCRPRPASPASCARTSSAGCPGCPSSASSASAASWPTTWAWARPSSCCRSSAERSPAGTAPRCWCARCRWSATGSARRRGSPRTSGCTCTTARTGWTATRSPPLWPGRTWSSPPTAWPPGTRPRSAR